MRCASCMRRIFTLRSNTLLVRASVVTASPSAARTKNCGVGKARCMGLSEGVGRMFTSDIATGMQFERVESMSAKRVAEFVRLTGDHNTLHSNQNDAIVPGSMCASMFPAIIGSEFPGSLYLKQTLKFRRPVEVGATIRAAVTVLRVRGSHVTFQTTCWTDDQVAVDGEALATLRAKP